MMTADEIKALLEENESLRNEVDYLRNASGPNQTDGAGNGPLCKGCYAWRLGVATVVSLLVATGVWIELDGHPVAVRQLQAALGLGTGEEASSTLKLLIAFLVAAAGPLLLVLHWKWRLYKSGYPGLLAGIIAGWRALKEGMGQS